MHFFFFLLFCVKVHDSHANSKLYFRLSDVVHIQFALVFSCTHKHTCSLLFMLTLAGWMKSSFSRDKGCVSSTCSTALFCTPQTDPCHEIPPVYLSSTSNCDVVCVLTHHTLNTESSYICFIYCFVLLLYTDTKSTIAKFDLRALRILLIIHIFPISPLCWDCFIYCTFRTNICKPSLLWCTMWCSSSVAQCK